MKNFLQNKLKIIQKANWTRNLEENKPNGSPNQRLKQDKNIIQFCSNDYLGLSFDKRLANAGYKAVLEYGSGSTGSRLITGTNNLYSLLERELAQLKNQESSLFFSSGYMANMGCIIALMGSKDIIYTDQFNHSSLIMAARSSGAKVEVYEHLNYKNLKDIIQNTRFLYQNALIISDLIFSMDGDIACVQSLSETAEQNNCWLMLDEAHSTGVYDFDYSFENLIRMGTCSKGLGVEGGFIAGNKDLIEYLIQRAKTFIYSTAISPFAIGALLESLKIIKNENWRKIKLLENAQKIKEFCHQENFSLISDQSQIICIKAKNNEQVLFWAKKLLEQNIWVSAIRPPTVPIPRLRITVNCLHTEKELEKLFSALKKIKNVL